MTVNVTLDSTGLLYPVPELPPVREDKPLGKTPKTPVKSGPPKRVTFTVVPSAAAHPRTGLKVGSTRVRLFKCLSRTDHTEGFSVKEIKAKCGMSPERGASGHLSCVIAEELERGRIKCRLDHRGHTARGIKVYYLTALGRRDLQRGTIDGTRYAGKRIGRAWTEKQRSAR